MGVYLNKLDGKPSLIYRGNSIESLINGQMAMTESGKKYYENNFLKLGYSSYHDIYWVDVVIENYSDKNYRANARLVKWKNRINTIKEQKEEIDGKK